MADIRALLAKERQSRRVNHPHATYTKSGVLSCAACQLPIRSEALWEGHLRSANHRRNAQRVQQQQNDVLSVPTKSLKRKIEDVDTDTSVANGQRVDAEDTNDRGYEVDNRKKPKSAASKDDDNNDDDEERDKIFPNGTSYNTRTAEPYTKVPDETISTKTTKRSSTAKGKTVRFKVDEPTIDSSPSPPQRQISPPEVADPTISIPSTTAAAQEEPIDEDEWAAFERDIAPLSSTLPAGGVTTTNSNDNNGITISAAPVSAAQLQAESEATRKRLRDVEGDEEKEDEGRRMEEEFDVMEEMEERVRRLRQKREALRSFGSKRLKVDDQGGSNTTAAADDDDDGGGGDGGGEQEVAMLDSSTDDYDGAKGASMAETVRTQTNGQAQQQEQEKEGLDDDEDEDEDEDDADDWYS